MLRKTTSILLFLMLFAIVAKSQDQPFPKFRTAQALKDSVFNKYVKNGAFRYSYFSNNWQKYLDSALSITPDNASLWQQKAMPYFKNRKYDVGMEYLDKAVALDSMRWIDYRAFIKCIFSKRYKDALVDFQEAKKIKEGSFVMDHSYDFYMGICYLQLNKLYEANECFQVSIENQKMTHGEEWVHFLDYFYLGIVQFEMEKYNEAIKCFDITLSSYKNFSDAKYYKTICLYKLNQSGEAKNLLNEAIVDSQNGYSFKEDNNYYEDYPYQTRPYQLKDLKLRN